MRASSQFNLAALANGLASLTAGHGHGPQHTFSESDLAALLDAAALPKSVETTDAPPAYHVPGPYEIALAVGAAMAASDKYMTPGAALQAAWAAVPEFYIGRDTYLQQIAPIVYGYHHGGDVESEA